MKKILLAGLILISAPVFAENWKMESKVDAMTDKNILFATNENDEGFTFTLYKRPSDQEIWMIFSVPDESSLLIDGQKLITFRVDKLDANEIGPKSSMFEKLGWIEWNPTFLNLSMLPSGASYQHQGKQEDTSNLYSILNGSKLLVRVFNSLGGSKDTEFNLSSDIDIEKYFDLEK